MNNQFKEKKSGAWRGITPGKRRFLFGLLLALAIGTLMSLAFSNNLFSSIQMRSGDLLFTSGGPSPASQGKVVIIGIDDRSLDKLGRFADWDRSYYAQVVDELSSARARIVLFDILFSEPADGDEELAASIKQAGNVIMPLVASTGLSMSDNSQLILKPLEGLAVGTLALGHANIVPDADGVVRRLPAFINGDNDPEPALALTAVAKYLRRPGVIDGTPNQDTLLLAGRSIPAPNNDILINYQQTAESPVVSFIDVLTGSADMSVFNDGIVLIGATATGLGDTYWTPVGSMDGVAIHARAIQMILDSRFLKTVTPGVTVALVILLSLCCGFIVLRYQTLWSVAFAILLLTGYLAAAFMLFDRGVVLNVVYPPLSIVCAFFGMNIYNLAGERAHKSRVIKTFGRYVSPSVAQRIIIQLDMGGLELGGQEQTVTVLFADVRGFTNLTEKTPPAELVGTLNQYLAAIIGAILKYDGMINKFAGDSVMAVWNAPTSCSEHALMAVRAAVAAQKAIKVTAESCSGPLMEFGIGINTGLAVAGNMGSSARLEYSVVGDAVNTAARLTASAPPGKIWIGPATFEAVKCSIAPRRLEDMTVKGKLESIAVYEVPEQIENTYEVGELQTAASSYNKLSETIAVKKPFPKILVDRGEA